jgi:hypothetical protein
MLTTRLEISRCCPFKGGKVEPVSVDEDLLKDDKLSCRLSPHTVYTLPWWNFNLCTSPAVISSCCIQLLQAEKKDEYRNHKRSRLWILSPCLIPKECCGNSGYKKCFPILAPELKAQSNDWWYRGSTELVQRSSSRGVHIGAVALLVL